MLIYLRRKNRHKRWAYFYVVEKLLGSILFMIYDGNYIVISCILRYVCFTTKGQCLHYNVF